MLAIFLYLKKNSVEIRFIFEKKIEKNFENNFCNFLFLKKKSVNSPIIKDRKLSKNKKNRK